MDATRETALAYQREIEEAQQKLYDLLAACGINMNVQSGDSVDVNMTAKGINIHSYLGPQGHELRGWHYNDFYTWDELFERRQKLESNLAKALKKGKVYHPVRGLDHNGHTQSWCGEGWKEGRYRTLPIEDFKRQGLRECSNCKRYKDSGFYS